LDYEVVLMPIAGAVGLGILAFAGYAWARRDSAAKSILLLTMAWGAMLFLLARAGNRGGQPSEGLVVAGLLAYLLIPGAYLLFGQGRWVQGRRLVGALVTGLGSASALPALLILPTVASLTLGSGAAMGGAIAPQPQFQALGDQGAMWNRAGVPMVEEAEVIEREKGAEPPQENGDAGQAPRLRQWFPETLYWAPEVQTDENGRASLEIPMADSITTWRLTALASSQDGRLGFATHGLRVFQDFFVDIDLPVSLTQGDEISIPVGVFNYLPQAQDVRLVVEPGDWFELSGEGDGERTLTIASNDIEVVYFPIRVLRFGQQAFQVTAWGEQMSDAIRREVDVVPDGKEVRLTESDWLRQDPESTDPLEVALGIPKEAVPGTSRVEVKIYPGVLAQVIEGLEKILRLPHG
jgi:hypothetical protein